MNRILGVSRSHRFSPNSIDRDNAIFQAVAVALRDSGYEVECVGEDDLTKQSLTEAHAWFTVWHGAKTPSAF